MGKIGMAPTQFTDANACVDEILVRVGRDVVLGLPAGLGKANSIANALYDRADHDRGIQLTIFTALTIGRFDGRSELERRFLEPLMDRLAGDYPELRYGIAARSNELPPNIAVHEFFLPAGRMLGLPAVQQNYISANYTHVNRTLIDRGLNVLAPLVAQRHKNDNKQISLSCNPDLTLDLMIEFDRARASGKQVCLAAQVNENLPFMLGPAVVETGGFDVILDGPGCQFDLFSVPKQPVSLAGYAAALRVATLIEDGGTLQVGIGGFGDALAHALKLRHLDNPKFRAMTAKLGIAAEPTDLLHRDPFSEGLYGCTEMLVEGFLELKRCGVVKRRVSEGTAPLASNSDPVIHAAMFVGSRAFLEKLKTLPDDEIADIAMTSISYVNQLNGSEELKRRQRVKARFVNTALMATVLGDVVSDELSDGRVISGVGGQYNFVAQAHELTDARSIIALNSTRRSGGRTVSNILWDYGHVTIPRHLRDIVVTEYGIANLRGKSDREVIIEMLNVTDSRFQSELLAKAKACGKIERTYQIPDRHRSNLPEKIVSALGADMKAGVLPAFPFGTEMTPPEVNLFFALKELDLISHSRIRLLFASLKGALAERPSEKEAQCFERLGLHEVKSAGDWLMRWCVLWGLRARCSL